MIEPLLPIDSKRVEEQLTCIFVGIWLFVAASLIYKILLV